MKIGSFEDAAKFGQIVVVATKGTAAAAALKALLAGLITRTIGEKWTTDLGRLRELEPCTNDSAFRQEFSAIKRAPTRNDSPA